MWGLNSYTTHGTTSWSAEDIMLSTCTNLSSDAIHIIPEDNSFQDDVQGCWADTNQLKYKQNLSSDVIVIPLQDQPSIEQIGMLCQPSSLATKPTERPRQILQQEHDHNPAEPIIDAITVQVVEHSPITTHLEAWMTSVSSAQKQQVSTTTVTNTSPIVTLFQEFSPGAQILCQDTHSISNEPQAPETTSSTDKCNHQDQVS